MLFQCHENLSLFWDVNSTKFFSKLFLKNNFIRILGKCFANFNSTRTNIETFFYVAMISIVKRVLIEVLKFFKSTECK